MIRGMRHTAIYAGTFDPLTLGHLDLIERATGIFDRVIIAVVVHSPKTTMFSIDDRLEMVNRSIRHLTRVEVDPFDGLLVEYARSRKVHVLLRGLRAFSDFEYEFHMALTNRKLAPEIETVFLMPQEIHSYISSSTVRQVLGYGGKIEQFVPDAVRRFIQDRRRRRVSARPRRRQT